MDKTKTNKIVEYLLFTALLIFVAYVGIMVSDNLQEGNKLEFVSEEDVKLEIDFAHYGTYFLDTNPVGIAQNPYVKNTGNGALYPYLSIAIPEYNDQKTVTIDKLGDGWTLLEETPFVYYLEYQPLNPGEESTCAIETATVNEMPSDMHIQFSYKSEGHSTRLVNQETARQLFLGTGNA